MAAMPATEIGAYEDDTKLHFDAESDLPRFFDSVLQRTDQISQAIVDEEIVEQHIVVVDETVRLLRILRNSSSNIHASDKETLKNDAHLSAIMNWAMGPDIPFVKQEFPTSKPCFVGPVELNLPLLLSFFFTLSGILNIPSYILVHLLLHVHEYNLALRLPTRHQTVY